MSLTAADKVEITELIARYMHALDSRDGEALAASFTQDGVLDTGSDRIVGRQALIDGCRGPCRRLGESLITRCRAAGLIAIGLRTALLAL